MTIPGPILECTMPDYKAKHLSGQLYDLDTALQRTKNSKEFKKACADIIKETRDSLHKFGPAYSHMMEKILATPAALPVLIGIDDELDTLIENAQKSQFKV